MDELEPTMEQLAYQQKEVRWFLDHEAVKNAFRVTEEKIKRDWEQADNTLAREWCWMKLQAFKEWKRQLRAAGDRLPKPEE